VSAYGEQIQAWLDTSLQVLKDDYRANPDREPRQRATEMWDRLGVTSGTGDPVIEELVTLFGDLLDRLGSTMTGEELAGYLAGDAFDREVVELIELAVSRHEPPPETAPDETTGTDTEAEAMASAEKVTEQVVRDLAMPVLRELARTRPDLVARHSTDELLAQLGQVIVQRLLEH
jgi:hypothetical protein